MKLLHIIILFAALLLTGCMPDESDRAKARAITESNLRSDGEHIGTLPDGRVVTRYWVINPIGHDHALYVVNGSVTVNRTEPQGKTTVNRVEVTIDGIPYVQKGKTP